MNSPSATQNRAQGRLPFRREARLPCAVQTGALVRFNAAFCGRHRFQPVGMGYPTMHCEWQPLLGLVTRYMGDAAGAQRILCENIAALVGAKPGRPC
jgi:hypothetical protein